MPLAQSCIVAVAVGVAAYVFANGYLSFRIKTVLILGFVVGTLITGMWEDVLKRPWQLLIILVAALLGIFVAHQLKFGPAWDQDDTPVEPLRNAADDKAAEAPAEST